MKNRKTGLSIWLAICVLGLLAVLPAMGCAETEGNGSGTILESILARGVLRVGTAGDYMPMSYLDPETGDYVGFDAELAEDLAAALGVKVQYIETSWPTLMEDTLAGKFDLAVCGITITEARKEQALMSEGYLGNGKTVLCRVEDAARYTSLEACMKNATAPVRPSPIIIQLKTLARKTEEAATCASALLKFTLRDSARQFICSICSPLK